MKTLRKTLIALTLVLGMSLSLSACDLLGDSFDPAGYVKGLLDITYLGKFDADFMKEHEYTDEEVKEMYDGNAEAEANIFLYSYTGQELEEYPNDELKARAIEMYKQIYAKCDYTVGECDERKDGNYNITIKIRPLNFIQLVDEGFYDWNDAWFEEFTASVDVEAVQAMGDEEYAQWETDVYYPAFVDALLTYAESKVADTDYMTEKSIVVQMEKTETVGNTDYYELNDEDWMNLDTILIDYSDNT